MKELGLEIEELEARIAPIIIVNGVVELRFDLATHMGTLMVGPRGTMDIGMPANGG